MQKTHMVALVAALAGCADREIDLGTHLEQLHAANGEGSPITVSGCRPQDGAYTERACVIDSAGINYPVGDQLVVTSAAPPYGAYVEFQSGLEIDPDHIGTQGTDAPIQAFAAPYNVQGDPCCSELDPTHRVAASASVPLEGGLLVSIPDAVPSGTQISIDIQFADLFRPLSANSGVEELCPGGGFDCAGYVFRFYVGAEPAVSGTPTSVKTIESSAPGTVPAGKGAAESGL